MVCFPDVYPEEILKVCQYILSKTRKQPEFIFKYPEVILVFDLIQVSLKEKTYSILIPGIGYLNMEVNQIVDTINSL